MASELWFYTDKEGKVHGPHSSPEMYQWFRMGYFPLDVLVKREKDPTFVTMQDMINMYNGQIPFVAGSQSSPRPGVIHPVPLVPLTAVTTGGGIPFPPPNHPSNPATPCPTPVPLLCSVGSDVTGVGPMGPASIQSGGMLNGVPHGSAYFSPVQIHAAAAYSMAASQG